MPFLAQISFDEVAGAFVVLALVRTYLVPLLPRHLAGPGGALLDTERG